MILAPSRLPAQVGPALALRLFPAAQLEEDVSRIATQECPIGAHEAAAAGSPRLAWTTARASSRRESRLQQGGVIGGRPHEVIEAACPTGDDGRFFEEAEADVQVAQVGGVHPERADGVAVLRKGVFVGSGRDRGRAGALGDGGALREAARGSSGCWAREAWARARMRLG